MLNLGALGFASPWLLLGLVALPILFWLVRVTPPAPRQISFPAIRLLTGLVPREQTPARTPWWLLLLRLLLAALVVIGLAGPLLNPKVPLAAGGPIVVVLDNGWPGAERWSMRRDAALSLVEQAGRAGRAVALVATAEPRPATPSLQPAVEARAVLLALESRAWRPDRAGWAAALAALEPGAEAVWFSDGVDGPGTAEMEAALKRLDTTRVVRHQPGEGAVALAPPQLAGTSLDLRALRADAGGARTLRVAARGEDGRTLGEVPVTFPAGETAGTGALALPVEIRNQVARLELMGIDSAGAVQLLDERWRRRPVGLISGAQSESAQPLLSDLFFLDRALTPFADVRQGTLADLLQRGLAVLVLADVGQIVGSEQDALTAWIEKGGVLLRFAGPRMAGQTGDALSPVRLRSGGRVLGGALSWEQPAALAPFPAGSPFAGLAIPEDVRINRQVLAEPDLDLPQKTWARLQDGTPLVTAARRGQGWIVLVHTTANTTWSNLPMSGLFVDMLRRMVAISQGIAGGTTDKPLAPYATLDGLGRLGQPPSTALPVKEPVPAAGPDNPPGFYGDETARVALNALGAEDALVPLPLFQGVVADTYAAVEEVPIGPWLLLVALVLLIVDGLVMVVLSGGLRPGRVRPARGATATTIVLAAALAALSPALAPPAMAQASPGSDVEDARILDATLNFHLAYILTGEPEVDAMSRSGLFGLTRVLAQRTAVEGGDPLGVDLDTDELSVFSLLYWPMTSAQAPLSDAALEKLDRYLKQGGMILLDTRDGVDGTGGGEGTETLRNLLGRLDVPPLVPLPPDHVLSRSFYLMQSFPGRYAGAPLWVEAGPESQRDGVSSIIVGANDWAAAWAIDDYGEPMAGLVPGSPDQRELANRFGVNLVMYALTGNYKADQVHVPALLERLGQ
ncbi:DUF4159 domain-containing protein [Zavarzinia sp. CC-PAN008]|uniref:DUF4159 domain-containing protein n=1 Tax=Zavarzinia sp. CC-PAN008 TaxID=3243332 RepID=UPI003F7425F0